MPEYIDREKIRLEVCSDCTRHVSFVCQNPEPCYKLLAAFLEAKPVDVAPVVHGKWKIMHVGRTIKCSNCGIIFDRFVNGAQLPEHCFCGAKMDGGGKANE